MYLLKVGTKELLRATSIHLPNETKEGPPVETEEPPPKIPEDGEDQRDHRPQRQQGGRRSQEEWGHEQFRAEPQILRPAPEPATTPEEPDSQPPESVWLATQRAEEAIPPQRAEEAEETIPRVSILYLYLP